MKKFLTPRYLLIIGLPVILLVLVAVYAFAGSSDKVAQRGYTYYEDDTSALTVIVTGDAMMHMPQYKAALNPATGKPEFDSCYNQIRSLLQLADLRMVNFETVLAGEPYSGFPRFSAPEVFPDALVRAGFNVFVLANNHAADQGGKGIEGTLAYFEKNKLNHTGIFRNQSERDKLFPLMLETKGWKIAFLNYSYSTNGLTVPEPYIVNQIDTITMARDLAKAKLSGSDAILVSMHWGNEYQRTPSAEQRQIESFLYRHGVDVIIGSHPHVLQSVDFYVDKQNIRPRLTIWSLGNFISNQKDEFTDEGLFVMFTLRKSRYGAPEISEVKYIPFWRYKDLTKRPGYYLLPAGPTETNPARYISSAEDRAKFAKVVASIRKTVEKNNKVEELKSW